MTNQKKNTATLIGIGTAVAVLIACGIALTNNIGKSTREISEEDALKKMDKLLKNVTVTETTPRKATVDFSGSDLANSLPDINTYPLTITGNGEIDIEIFVSPEKAGTGSDGWMIETAKAFNSQNLRTTDNHTMSVSIRNITSGTGSDYIVSGKYLPDAYTPSNTMWGTMAVSNGADLHMISEKLAGNVAGILISENMVKTLSSDYGDINIETITNASKDGKIAMGYTYPYTSSTGLNFLVSALHSFDNANPLSNTAVENFQQFQANVPFVCYTTQQMRNAMGSGSLNACIMEYQTYVNDPSLQKSYQFIPFGVRHDNPMYAVGNLTTEKEQVLQAFTDFCLSSEQQENAKKCGFNQMESYHSTEPEFDAVTLLNAQKLWKEEKDSGRPVVAVFIADVSGSMIGDPLNRLKESLKSSSQYIGSKNYIGLVSYSNDVQVNLPIGEFDLNQRSYFTGAVEDLSASGATCTYDAVLQGIKMLEESKSAIPNAKPMLFVLSDGETNLGAKLRDISDIVDALNIPIYTIGYNANLSELTELSAINEAASIDADSEDVIYKLGSLFNAQM
ncbi:MAG TPA: VWA domain-containing protein [Ruminococcus sp.]|nr:VWA domain-containing protein [Ruminococcus sp.]